LHGITNGECAGDIKKDDARSHRTISAVLNFEGAILPQARRNREERLLRPPIRL
jgi:hypothetical protein